MNCFASVAEGVTKKSFECMQCPLTFTQNVTPTIESCHFDLALHAGNGVKVLTYAYDMW